MYLALTATICLLSMLSVLEMLYENDRTNSFSFYLQLRISTNSVFVLVSKIVGLLTFCAHFITIFFLWLAIRCWGLAPPIVSIMAIVMGIVGIIYTDVVSSSAGNAHARAKVLVRDEMTTYNGKRRSDIFGRYRFYLWKSQPPVGIPCGSFCIIEKSFVLRYTEELANNLANAVLL